ncbi:hypothetical protein [Nocardiopsis coralliicola]
MRTSTKAAAAREAVTRGEQAAAALSPPPALVIADTAAAHPRSAPKAAPFTASASFRGAVSDTAAALQLLHGAWTSRGFRSVLQPGRTGEVEARDADGFTYTATVTADESGIALWVESPMFLDAEPDSVFPPIRPT